MAIFRRGGGAFSPISLPMEDDVPVCMMTRKIDFLLTLMQTLTPLPLQKMPMGKRKNLTSPEDN